MKDNLTQKTLKAINTQNTEYWKRIKEHEALKLFHSVATRVPAYKDFLKKHHIAHEKIKNFKDFQHVPLANKNNYLREYPVEALSWDGTIKKSLVFTATSGSTSEPFYFHRDVNLDWQYSIILEKYLKNKHNQGPTLVIICLGMGVWIGGLITYQAFQYVSQRGKYPLSLLTPGTNKKEIFSSLKNIAPHFKQIILCGYPPFIKDIIDEAPLHGIELSSLPLRFLFAAESFTENFRDYLAEKTGMKNLFLDTMNIYGSADIGAMGFETPLSILLRREALKNNSIFDRLFSSHNKTPTLAQYIPSFICFESISGEIVLTGKNSLPLVRYAIGDSGGVFDASEAGPLFENEGIDIKKIAKKEGIASTFTELPFVYIYERSDFSTKLYGAIVFPEHVKSGLITKELASFVTGKFTMITRTDKNQDSYLEINIELKPGIFPDKTLKKSVTTSVIISLRKRSTEYENNFLQNPKRMTPKIVFWSHENKTHFQTGIKQQWVKKAQPQ